GSDQLAFRAAFELCLEGPHDLDPAVAGAHAAMGFPDLEQGIDARRFIVVWPLLRASGAHLCVAIRARRRPAWCLRRGHAPPVSAGCAPSSRARGVHAAGSSVIWDGTPANRPPRAAATTIAPATANISETAPKPMITPE